MQRLPENSVRGRIQAFLIDNKDKMLSPTLEIGSRMPDPRAWWTVIRELGQGEWIGFDVQPGPNVDMVGDAHQLPYSSGEFGSVVCSEVLEHVRRPWVVIAEVYRVLRAGGHGIFTSPFAFPIHSYPTDYWRMTPECIREMLQEAGFVDVVVVGAGSVPFDLNDHGERGVVRRESPMHVFATCRKPS